MNAGTRQWGGDDAARVKGDESAFASLTTAETDDGLRHMTGA